MVKAKRILNKKVLLTVFMLVLVSAVVVSIGLYNNGRLSYDDCSKDPSSKVKVQESKIECSLNGKKYTKDQKSTSVDYKVYKDDVVSFQYPGNWKVEKVNDDSKPKGIYLLSISSPYTPGTLSSTGGVVDYKLLASIQIDGASSAKPVCLGCEVKSNTEVKFIKPTNPFWQTYYYDGGPYGTPVNAIITNNKIPTGTKDFAGYAELPNNRFLVMKSSINTKYTDEKGETELVPVTNADDFAKSSVNLIYLDILKTLSIN